MEAIALILILIIAGIIIRKTTEEEPKEQKLDPPYYNTTPNYRTSSYYPKTNTRLKNPNGSMRAMRHKMMGR